MNLSLPANEQQLIESIVNDQNIIELENKSQRFIKGQLPTLNDYRSTVAAESIKKLKTQNKDVPISEVKNLVEQLQQIIIKIKELEELATSRQEAIAISSVN